MRTESVTPGQKSRRHRDPALNRAAPASPSPAGPLPSALLALQQRAGNRATVGWIQHKLEVGSADDPLEAEADQVAQQVLRRISVRPASAGEAGAVEAGAADTTNAPPPSARRNRQR